MALVRDSPGISTYLAPCFDFAGFSCERSQEVPGVIWLAYPLARVIPESTEHFPEDITKTIEVLWYIYRLKFSRWPLSDQGWEGNCLSRVGFGKLSMSGISMLVVTDNLVSFPVEERATWLKSAWFEYSLMVHFSLS